MAKSTIKPITKVEINIIPITRDSEKYQEIVQRFAEGAKTALPKLVGLKKDPPPAA